MNVLLLHKLYDFYSRIITIICGYMFFKPILLKTNYYHILRGIPWCRIILFFIFLIIIYKFIVRQLSIVNVYIFLYLFTFSIIILCMLMNASTIQCLIFLCIDIYVQNIKDWPKLGFIYPFFLWLVLN